MKKFALLLAGIVVAGSALAMPIKPPNCQSTFICPPAVAVADSALAVSRPPPKNCNGLFICPPEVAQNADISK